MSEANGPEGKSLRVTMETKAQYRVRMDKHGGTWYYFTQNPQGGGSGSNHSGGKGLALILAKRTIPAGATYQVVTNGKPGKVEIR